jgi:hypothetical protein
MVQQELTRRQIIAQLEASIAAKETAEQTKRNANYLLCSVSIVALTSVANLLVTWFRS